MSCSLDVTKIAPGVYQGSAPPGGLEVRNCGFDALVLTAQEYQPPSGAYPGVDVLRAPINDGELTWREWDACVHVAQNTAARVLEGQRVLITCFMGRNRSGLVTVLTLHMLTGKRSDLLVKHVQQHRRGALTNSSFVRALKVYAG